MPASAKAELLAPGAQIGRYHLLRRLAIGGMAELHLACAGGVAGFQKVVVLKRVLPHLAADACFVDLFLNEARLAANLDHPNLVQVMDIGEADGEYFYVMEYVHGRNVRELLAAAANRGGLPLSVALAVVIAAAAGLHHAHERTDLDGRPLGLVHRDVSPSNVLISYDGAIKVTDFGIAKASARSAETIGGAMKGKIGYMSPEQCRGEAVDRRSDVFALGILLYELTTTERLFFAESDFAVLNKVVHGRFDRPSERVPGYPAALEPIVLRALALEPGERYPSAEAMLRDVEAFAHEQHLRCSSAVVADWMVESFGRPPFPRVESRAPDPEDPLELLPTLVVVGDAERAQPDARTRVEPYASGEEPAGADAAVPTRRPRRGWRLAALAGVLGIGVIAGAAWIQTDEQGRAAVEPAAERPSVAARPATSGAQALPADGPSAETEVESKAHEASATDGEPPAAPPAPTAAPVTSSREPSTAKARRTGASRGDAKKKRRPKVGSNKEGAGKGKGSELYPEPMGDSRSKTRRAGSR